MDRVALEIKLNRERAWLLETFAALSPEELTRGATPSEHDPASVWTPKDHLAHLAGIEGNFNRMIRRHFGGDKNPVGLRQADDGTPRSREETMAIVHEMTEAWTVRHRDKTFFEVVDLGQRIRSETLALIAELSDEQLTETLPGAPWADGTVGGVLGVNGDHGRMHWRWLTEAGAVSG